MASKSSGRPRVPFWSESSFWLTLAMVTFGTSTLVALTQSARDPYEPLRLGALSGWLSPSDPGRAQELPAITTDLRAVYAEPKDPRKIWIAGNAGTILYSENGGKSWTRQEIVAAPAPSITQTAAQVQRR